MTLGEFRRPTEGIDDSAIVGIAKRDGWDDVRSVDIETEYPVRHHEARGWASVVLTMWEDFDDGI